MNQGKLLKILILNFLILINLTVKKGKNALESGIWEVLKKTVLLLI